MFFYELEQEYKERGYQFYHADQSAAPSTIIEETEAETKRKCILLLTHQLSRTGAPLALFTMAMVLKREFDVMILTVEDGELARDYLEAGISVVNAGRYWERKVVFKSFARRFDGVVANTVLHFPAIVILDGLQLPVFWWIHEHENYFSYGRGEIPNPKNLKENIHIMVAGEYVRQVMLMEFGYDAAILHVGMEPLKGGEIAQRGAEELLHFLCVGTYSMEKGQDILVKAYQSLPQDYKERLSLTFIGNDVEKDDGIYGMVKELEREEPLVSCHPLMPRPEALTFYKEADGVIASSRREVLSMVVLENMMLEKCVLVSSATGNAAFIEDGVNGYVFEADNVLALRDALMRMLDQRNDLPLLGRRAALVYQQYFSMEVFERNVRRMITDFIQNIR